MSRPTFGVDRDPLAAKEFRRYETEAAKDARFVRELKASLKGVTVACPGCGETMAPQDLIPHEAACASLDSKP